MEAVLSNVTSYIPELFASVLVPGIISYFTAKRTAKFKIKSENKQRFINELEGIVEKATIHFRTEPDESSERVAIVLSTNVKRIPHYFSERRRKKPHISDALAAFKIAVMQDADSLSRRPLAEDNLKFVHMREKAEDLKRLF